MSLAKLQFRASCTTTNANFLWEIFLIKKLIGTCIAATVLAVTGKVVSDYAETKPALKNVKDKLKKTGKDFSANCKEVLDATRRVFTGETPDENKITLATETAN